MHWTVVKQQIKTIDLYFSRLLKFCFFSNLPFYSGRESN